MQTYPMTVEGAEALKAELHDLKYVQRPLIIEAIATAREHGDLKENAEYHAAREQQSFNEGRVHDIEAKLSRAKIIDVRDLSPSNKVVFGATVKVIQLQTETEMIFKIVGEDEADIKINKISYSSPLAKALIGKQVDDCVVVQTPGGLIEYEIIEVTYV